MNLRDYERAKFEMAELLRAGAAAARQGGEADEDRLRELFVRLAEDRFNLVVVGRFSRGKTSLMNAVLGSDRLPIGIVPLTSVITTVAYGSRERLTVRYEDDRLPSELALESLPEYVTQQHNPGNVRGVRTADVQLPAEILRRGFHFIDTPGLASPIAANTRTTESFLPQADAFILVTSYDSPLSAEELRVLREASASGRRAFVVLNKQDIVSADERAEALRYSRELLRDAFGAAAPFVFSVSARDALAARRAGDPVALAGSGIEAFESELLRFLLSEKRGEFLLRLCNRAEDLLRTLPHSAELAASAEGIRSLARRTAEEQYGTAVRASASTGMSVAQEGWRQLRGCAVCERMLSAAFEFLSRYQYDLSVSPGVQKRHADNGGFCPLHTWQYASLASPHGVSTGYPALLERLSERLGDAAEDPSGSSAVGSLVPTRASCLVCRVCADAEAQTLAALAGEALRGESGPMLDSAICLSHLSLLIGAVGDGSVARRLLQRAATILDRLAEDMRRYATKHDAVRRSLVTEEETDAGQRALAAVAGLRNVHLVPRAPS
jgi:GTP-binding protein EngB required for normal cell division